MSIRHTNANGLAYLLTGVHLYLDRLNIAVATPVKDRENHLSGAIAQYFMR